MLPFREFRTLLRLVSLTKKFDHLTPVLRSLHWLPISQRIQFKILLDTYKAINGLVPQYITDFLTPLRRSTTLLTQTWCSLFQLYQCQPSMVMREILSLQNGTSYKHFGAQEKVMSIKVVLSTSHQKTHSTDSRPLVTASNRSPVILMGLVVLVLNKSEADVRNNQQQLVDSLFRVLGGKPTLSVCVEDVKSVPVNKCEVTIYIMERLANGITKRLSAQIAYNVFNQASVQAQLGSLGVVRIAPKIQISSSQLQEYLNHPPLGYDPNLWKQAQLDNPDPSSLIPVPLVGFETLKSRLEQQAQFTSSTRQDLSLSSFFHEPVKARFILPQI
ncbi:putative nuclear pore complex protein [Apostichopus japonicus]|uniref:Putative nuclear pore complex protein n=1 Tax=Stichopus japonicus TaxID=307972 RepID=A0A2G8KSQ6_STIJA|nr:putative nuclear pore complex protein [Apostichopus japonicus]